MRAARRLCTLPLLLLTACGSKAPLGISDGCNPLLAPGECFFPFPSDFYRVDDPNAPGGHRIVFSGPSKLRAAMGLSADPTDWREMDGFSRVGTISTTFSSAVGRTKLVGIKDPPDNSTSPATSATQLVHADSARAVAHYVDLDPLAKDPEHQALIISPSVELAENARYVVLISGLTGSGGKMVPVPEGFRRLRDGEASSDRALEKLADHYEKDIFPVAATIGIARKDLQLAWDFTTGADEIVVEDMMRTRELTLRANEQTPPSVHVEAVEEPTAADSKIWRIVRGTIRGPRFVDSDKLPTGALVRGSDGEVQLAGTLDFPFIAVMPIAIRSDTSPARVLSFGHGFFASRREVEGEAPVEIANRLHAMIFGIDWWGMSEQDRFVVLDGLVNSPSRLLAFTDGVHQAMANWLTAYRAIPGALAHESAFHRPTGELVYDPNEVGFLGISQGSILGGVLAALTPVKRIALNVGGGSWTQMMFRANPFQPFLEIMSYSIVDPLDRQKFTAQLARYFDRIDPAIYARYVLDEPPPGAPTDRRVLMQIGLRDTSVPTVAAFLQARILGAAYTTPSAIEVWGLAPFDGSQRAAITFFDFGVDTSFELDRKPPLMETPVHEGVRRLASCQKQLDLFLRSTGMIVNPCDGPCHAP
jgi:hypothetical protein